MSDQTPNSQPPASSRSRSTISTVVVVIGILLFLFVSRSWNEDTSSSESADGAPIAQQLPAEDADAEGEASSEGEDAAGEASDSAASDNDAEMPSASDDELSAEDAGASADAPRAPPGMETISTDELPPEALETMALIESGGPFPYSKDGSTFQNREGILPDEPMGYYAEYTVDTPGSSDRGARRIVGGEDGELYYTDDHYDSFSWIVIE